MLCYSPILNEQVSDRLEEASDEESDVEDDNENDDDDDITIQEIDDSFISKISSLREDSSNLSVFSSLNSKKNLKNRSFNV